MTEEDRNPLAELLQEYTTLFDTSLRFGGLSEQMSMILVQLGHTGKEMGNVMMAMSACLDRVKAAHDTMLKFLDEEIEE